MLKQIIDYDIQIENVDYSLHLDFYIFLQMLKSKYYYIFSCNLYTARPKYSLHASNLSRSKLQRSIYISFQIWTK